jgi:hypothetical protein
MNKFCAPCEVPGCDHISLDNLVVAIPGPRGHEILVLCPRHDQARKRADARALLAAIRRTERITVNDVDGSVQIVQRAEVS